MGKKREIDYIWRDRKRTLFGLPWSFTTYFLTETKFITRCGFFNLTEDEFDLYKVTDKKLLLPFWQRIVGCGSIVLFVRGDTDTPEKLIRCVKNPRDVLKELDIAIDRQRDRWNTRGRDLYSITGGMPGHHHHHADDTYEDFDECDGYGDDDGDDFDDFDDE